MGCKNYLPGEQTPADRQGTEEVVLTTDGQSGHQCSPYLTWVCRYRWLMLVELFLDFKKILSQLYHRYIDPCKQRHISYQHASEAEQVKQHGEEKASRSVIVPECQPPEQNEHQPQYVRS